MLRLRQALLALLAIGALGCANDESYDREALLETLVDDVFLPSYGGFVMASEDLGGSAMVFCADPTPMNLDALQATWLEIRAAYGITDAHTLGPQLEYPWRIEPTVDGIARPSNIDAILAGMLVLDEAAVAGLGATEKGMHAFEYLAFDPVGGDGAVLASFTDPMSGARRCEYLLAISANLTTQAEALEAAWAPSGDDYRAFLVDPASVDGPYTDHHDAVAGVVNGMIRTVEQSADNWLGTPAGKDGGFADPVLVESPYAQASIEDLHATLDGLEAVYQGSHDGDAAEASLQDWVRGSSADADARVVAAFAAARDALDTIAAPIAEAVLTDAQSVIDACLAFDALRLSMEEDIAEQINVPLTFSGDGD